MASHAADAGVLLFSDGDLIVSWGDQYGSIDRADEVTLSRKGANSPTRRRKLRSTGTKARTDSDTLRTANADLKKKLAEAREHLAEALERQTATSEVLQVISSSPGELEPVFETILANAQRKCEAEFGGLLLYEEGKFRHVALHNAPAAFVEVGGHEPFRA